MPRPRRDDIFDGVPLAPSGLPELICRVCGGPKPPKQKCYDCYITGRLYRGREITDPALQLKISQKRRKLISNFTKQYRTRHPKKRQHWRMRKRFIQITELDRLLDNLFKCFEKDFRGDWQLYADRLFAAQEALDEIEILLPRIRKWLDYGVGVPEEMKATYPIPD